MTPQPIETLYAGVRFRSRLEARWAFVFNSLGYQWDYEPEAFKTEYGNYLPDFRIRATSRDRWDCVEIKPRIGSDETFGGYWPASGDWHPVLNKLASLAGCVFRHAVMFVDAPGDSALYVDFSDSSMSGINPASDWFCDPWRGVTEAKVRSVFRLASSYRFWR